MLMVKIVLVLLKIEVKDEIRVDIMMDNMSFFSFVGMILIIRFG